MALMFPSVLLVLNLSTTAVVWFGGHLVADGSMQIGALTAFITYLAQILTAVMMATFMFMLVPRAEVSAERIMEVIDTEPGVAAPASPRSMSSQAAARSPAGLSCGTSSSAIPGPKSRCCMTSA